MNTLKIAKDSIEILTPKLQTLRPRKSKTIKQIATIKKINRLRSLETIRKKLMKTFEQCITEGGIVKFNPQIGLLNKNMQLLIESTYKESINPSKTNPV